ncbi:hypothetical protein [Bradyrhizobium sp. HKCCYLS20291]|uniref:hypothetical protein n=1 Tax=Bradyrhizobium sp. HKCCYLS20291 TaxID=3420766 RepID=UPI003EB93D92
MSHGEAPDPATVQMHSTLRFSRERRALRPSIRLQAMLTALMLCLGCLVPGGTAVSRADDLQSGRLAQADSYQAYVDQVAAVETDFGPAISPIAGLILTGQPKPWLRFKSFQKLRQLSAQHPEFFLRLVSDPAETHVHRFLAAWSLSDLGKSDLAAILNRMVELRQQGLISSRDLELVFSPFPPSAVACNDGDPEVRSVLQRILGLNDLTQEFRSDLEDALSGKLSRIWRRDNGGECSARR